MQYIQTPVFSNSHLREEIIRSVLFINCGGILNHTTFWYYKPTSKVQLFIFDSHRPFNHFTLIDPLKKVYIIHDGCKSFDEFPTQEDQMIYQQLQNEDSDSDEDEEEDEDSEDEEVKEELENLKDSENEEAAESDEDVYGERVEKRKDEDEEAEVVDGGDEEMHEVKVGQKRQRDEKEQIQDRRKLKRQKRMKFRNYYNGQFYYKCCSYLMYQVSQSLNRETREMLWLWIVGMTDLIIHYKQSSYNYSEDELLCDEEVQRLNPNIYNIDINEDDFDQNDDENNNGARKREQDLFKMISLQSRNKEIGTISMETELRLMLLRHWSLYESMCNSNYLVAKMTLWKEPGQKQMRRFLATVGISLEEAKQSYGFMEPGVRNTLKQRISDASLDFSLDNIMQKTYMLQLDSKTQILATDMAYALTSILESPRNLTNKQFQSSLVKFEEGKSYSDVSNLLSNRVQGTLNQSTLLMKEIEQREHLEYIQQCKYDNFYVALDALDKNRKNLLEKGIDLAKDIQKAIIHVGTSIIDKKQIKIANRFRYVMIDNDYLKDVELFQYPLALQKLALFLMETYKAIKLNSKEKPLIISVRNSKKGTTMICAVLGQSIEVDYGRNNFNDFFRQIVESKNLKAKHDAFDTSIIEIRNEDFRAFIDELSNSN
ncbi:cdc45 domain containing protein [Stylonychia lemnae]|uniref:Cdc45 domain containing protein n=1 Tax=Stylonychia lemnae TaxID=5949 RepID=A0A077ZYD2_STYLE|nr:cdc45 domain containing protein [Stylonychia lemnae]|eukprot:CDW74860.1 cdc45 domain containing protein [Stylonychia lemnae]